jgi:hypothetical protein
MLVTLTLPRTSQYIAFASSPSLMTSWLGWKMLGRRLLPMDKRNESGADWKSGKAFKRSRSSKGKPAIVELPNGDDLTGLLGFTPLSKLWRSVYGSDGFCVAVCEERSGCRRMMGDLPGVVARPH